MVRSFPQPCACQWRERLTVSTRNQLELTNDASLEILGLGVILREYRIECGIALKSLAVSNTPELISKSSPKVEHDMPVQYNRKEQNLVCAIEIVDVSQGIS